MKLKAMDLVRELKSKNSKNSSFIDRIKISYRPLICPFHELLNEIPENSSVFDIGCGSGMFLSLVQTFRKPKKLAGIEISERLIANAKEILADHKDLNLQVFDGKNLPENLAEYDYITLIDVFHHIPKKQQNSFMKQLFAKMKNGATLIFKDIDGSSILKYWNKFHDLILAGEVGHEVSPSYILDLAKRNPSIHLSSQRNKRMFLYPHYTVTLKKK